MGDRYFAVTSTSYQPANKISLINVHIHNCIAVFNSCSSTGPTDQTTYKTLAGGSFDFNICIAGLDLYRIFFPYISNQTTCSFNLIRSICRFDGSTNKTIFYCQSIIYITNQDANSRIIVGSFNHRIFYGQILNFTIRRNFLKQSRRNHISYYIQASNRMSASIKFYYSVGNRCKWMFSQINIAHQLCFLHRVSLEICKFCSCANLIITLFIYGRFRNCRSIPLILRPYRLKCHISFRHGIAFTAGICSGSVTPAPKIHAVYLKGILWKRNLSSGCGTFQCRHISLGIIASRRKGNCILRRNRKIHRDCFYRIIPGFITQINRSRDTSVLSRILFIRCRC